MKKIVTGIFAHVDAGKTTLSEAMLYGAGVIDRIGRVDHRDSFLDTDSQERERGITIFSKQAEICRGDMRMTLLDTPGHVDFSAEMERTLRVLDYAVLVISGKDGIQGHTMTLWRLFRRYEVPVFIFANKMDICERTRPEVLDDIRASLGDGIHDLSSDDEEDIAMCDEDMMEEYLEEGCTGQLTRAAAVERGHLFPVYFGSALKTEGVEELMDGIETYTLEREYPGEFSATVYKITRDEKGGRLTHMKITGGSLSVKDVLVTGRDEEGKDIGEKADQIRFYSGDRYRMEQKAVAGDICAVTGPALTFAGQRLGEGGETWENVLQPALIYNVSLSGSDNVNELYSDMKKLQEEDPQLNLVWNDELRIIQLQLMGEVQLEILKNVIKERFGKDVEFSEGQVAYKETIALPSRGGGHFEPLRHFAEVKLLLEPLPRGRGLEFGTTCSEDVLDRNWQRLIFTHLREKEHRGVLTGSPITDMKITITGGRAHLKHTEGGDFRQATYRAVRNGLRRAESVLLEPFYEFTMEVPSEMIGRAMSDVQKMGGSFEAPESSGEYSILMGKAPVSGMKDYSREFISYTKGFGRLFRNFCGYEECRDAERVIAERGYDVDRDLENTADSVFCEHGAGFNVPWDAIEDFMDITGDERGARIERGSRMMKIEGFDHDAFIPEKRTEVRRRIPPRITGKMQEKVTIKKQEVMPEYLLVDGYNIIFAWDELKSLAKVSLDGARDALIEILANYQGYRKNRIIAVFDAYKVKGGERHTEKHGNIDVVFTKEAETADTYIEKTTYEMKGKYRVRVATSDRAEQMIITGNGAFRMSADEFRREIEAADREIKALVDEHNRKNSRHGRNPIRLPE